MAELDNSYSREVQSGLLGRKYPHIREKLEKDEILLVVSTRNPQLVSGLLCFALGAFMLLYTPSLFVFDTLLTLILLLTVAAFIWTGIRLTKLVKREYMFVTNSRVVHQKTDLLGRVTVRSITIPLAEISRLHLYRSAIMLRGFNSTNGDLAIKKKNGKSHLIPSLTNSEDVAEILKEELQRYRKHAATDDAC
jgi:hypothetical protein